jgi:calnexin
MQPTKLKGVFVEQFTSDWSDRWSPSHATKEIEEGKEQFSYVGKWAVEEPSVFKGMIGDKGLVVKNAAAHHAISAPFEVPLDNTDNTLVVQYIPN